MSKLGMYIHTHWSYNRPYAARTWTLEDWRGYLSGLASLGYDFLMFWPLLDSMPAEPNANDRAFLEKIARVIRIAHDEYDMRFAITMCPNSIGNAASADFAFEKRQYFECDNRINPADASAVDALLEGRRRQLEFLKDADAIAIIDSDPGGYIGSTNAEFVALVKAQTDIFRELHSDAELIYWMWAGWENNNQYLDEITRWDETKPQPQWKFEVESFIETLGLMKKEIAEPWSVFACLPEHVEATDKLDIAGKRWYFPYGLIEREPSFPLTNYEPASIEEGLRAYSPAVYPQGLMANAQTPCLQLANIYLYSHFARGGSASSVDLAGFADTLIPGKGALVARAWQAIGSENPREQIAAAREIRAAVGKTHRTGENAGLLFGSAERFLEDLAENLDIRAGMVRFKDAIDAGGDAKKALAELLGKLKPYQKKVGFDEAYLGPLVDGLNKQAARLHDEKIDRALIEFLDLRNFAARHHLLTRFLGTLEEYCRS